MNAGRVVVLNGAPRSGKTSLARELIRLGDGPWLNLGVDALNAALPERLRPGIGLRPGARRPDIEPYLPALYAGLYEAAISFAREGVSVVVDVGHHQKAILRDCARRVENLPAWLVGVRCPLDEILRRRAASDPALYAQATEGGIPAPILRWQEAVHEPGVYDLEIDTARLSPENGARLILAHIAAEPPRAFETLASG